MKATGRRLDMSQEIPPHVLYASPVPLNAPLDGASKGQTLPLSLIAHVISYVSRTLNPSNFDPMLMRLAGR
jgi:hypothetical protein